MRASGIFNTAASKLDPDRQAKEWFRGSGSFIRNNYAIYPFGIAPDSPNPKALDAGYPALKTFYRPSFHWNSSFSKFIAAMEQIAKNEEAKEEQYLQNKIAQFESLEKYDTRYVSLVRQCFAAKELGSAFTLINKRNKSYEALLNELHSPAFNAQHSNEFWADQFSTYFVNLFYSKVDGNWLPNNIEDLSVDSIIDQFFENAFMGGTGILQQASDMTRNEMKGELQKLLVKYNITTDEDITSTIFKNNPDPTILFNMAKRKTKKTNKDRSIGAMLREVGDKVAVAVGKGMPTEISTVSHAGSNLELGIIGQVGKQLNKKGKQQKVDAFQQELFSTEIPQSEIEKIGKEIFSGLANDRTGFARMKQEFTKAINELGVDQIFDISYNVKGYLSRRDLQIEGVGSFNSKIDELRDIASETGIMGTALDKLIFLLVNTTKGCIADRRQDLIGQYIAAICVAWMWDDYTEIFDISSNKDTTRLHLFNSGGAFLTASQIIYKTINDLKALIYGAGNGRSLVKVNIEPGIGIDEEEYAALRDEYKITDNSDPQVVLAKRWNKVRDDILSSGKLGIKFDQSAIEEMLGYLKTLQ